MKKSVVDKMTDAEVRELQEEWAPEQYDDWDEPARSMMKSVAETFYTLPVSHFREALIHGVDVQ